MIHAMRCATLLLGALLMTGCGGGGSGASGAAGETPFVPFFTSVYLTPAAGTEPIPLTGRTFSGQFSDDETTFDFLLD